jgi:hypothetical protein
MAQLGHVLAINKRIVHRIWCKERGDFDAHIGDRNLLSAEHDEHVIGHIATSFLRHCPVFPKQIRVYIEDQFNIVVPRDGFAIWFTIVLADLFI